MELIKIPKVSLFRKFFDAKTLVISLYSSKSIVYVGVHENNAFFMHVYGIIPRYL